jgi:hypothetical protein
VEPQASSCAVTASWIAPVGEVEGSACAGAQEVALIQREGLRERRNLDQTFDASGLVGRDADPIPTTADHLSHRADREASLVLWEILIVPSETPNRRGLPLPTDADPSGKRAAGRIGPTTAASFTRMENPCG